MIPGLDSALSKCLGLAAGDKVLVVYDDASRRVYEEIAEAAAHIDVVVEAYNIDVHDRPLRELPRGLARALEGGVEASFYVAGVRPGELPFREALIREATSRGASHVHMPKATVEILAKAASCPETARVIEALARAVAGVASVEVTSPAGTRVKLEVGRYRWVADTGVIPRGEWGNWPPGEVYTTPSSAEGVLVVDGVIGDYFSVKYGLLTEPVTVRLEGSRAVDIDGPQPAAELREYLNATPSQCGLRVGELGIGGNPAIREPIGNMLHDEKMPGAHIALGDPLGGRTGAPWTCPVHVDLLPLKTTVRAGSTTIIRNGELEL